ncbi:MAG: hypothetical protein ABIT71_21555 [Vicinamibacteraceae bacterium]
MIDRRRQAPVALAALLTLTVALPAAAQQAAEPATDDRPPGWSFVPGMGVSEMWDTNPTLAAEGDVQVGDFVTAVRPSLGLGFRGRRTTLRTDYAGTFDFYRELSERDRRDHRGTLDFTHQLTRRVQLFAKDQALVSPTTADASLAGATLLRRQQTRMNAFRGGFEAEFGPRTTLNASYASQWIDFARPDDEPGVLQPGINLLQGGHSHGAIGELRHRVTQRVALGADYQMQRAIVAGGSETFDVQSALGVAEFALRPSLTASLGYGYAWLTAGRNSFSDTGPAFNAGLDWKGRHSGATFRYSRAFLPSFGFGGTFQNEELRATLNAQLTRSVEWSGGVAISNNDPLQIGDPSLRSRSAQTSLGWLARRRLRFEVFLEHVQQDSQLAGGHVLRTRAGVQATVSQMVRATR